MRTARELLGTETMVRPSGDIQADQIPKQNKRPQKRASVAFGPDLRIRATFRLRRSTAMTYQKSVYSITWTLWRWEIWHGGRLLRCGTARTKAAAEMKARQAVTI
jgi:hypothetical protein